MYFLFENVLLLSLVTVTRQSFYMHHNIIVNYNSLLVRKRVNWTPLFVQTLFHAIIIFGVRFFSNVISFCKAVTTGFLC